MSKRIGFNVAGRVQGVNFRSFTQNAAQSHGLTGFVTNEADGSVAGEVQGDESALQRFFKDIGVGPSVAKVDTLDKKDLESKSGESSFKVV
ncbi:MAG: hypothetical protein Q9160_002807 [Pyrenula sp. 1 TL-2023]